jgi:hypothetical protein
MLSLEAYLIACHYKESNVPKARCKLWKRTKDIIQQFQTYTSANRLEICAQKDGDRFFITTDATWCMVFLTCNGFKRLARLKPVNPKFVTVIRYSRDGNIFLLIRIQNFALLVTVKI